jgi:FMN phosphatase YigB (HAD superfamily)
MSVGEIALNIVFDLGGVVFTWEPEAIITKVFADPEVQTRARFGLFGHEDWRELDRGTLFRHGAIERAAIRTGLPVSDIAELLRQVPPALVAIPETVDLLYRLKARGHRLFSYRLNGAETVFIDDTELNLETAAKLGLQTIKFEHPTQCESQLKVLGCF